MSLALHCLMMHLHDNTVATREQLQELAVAIRDKEFGDIRSIMDEIYMSPVSHEDANLCGSLLSAAVGAAAFTNDCDGHGWIYDEL